MKGLTNFLTELLKNSHGTLNAEIVQQELVDIRKLFISSRIKGSEIKLAVTKLAFFALAGIPVDFGVDQILYLLNKKSPSHIRIGYFGASLIFPYDSPSVDLVIPLLKTHLLNYKNDEIQNIALSYAASIFQEKQILEISPLVAEIVVCQTASEATRKKAIYFLARITQKCRRDDIMDLVTPSIESYLTSPNWSLRLAAITLVLSVVTVNPRAITSVFDTALKQLLAMFVEKDPGCMEYYGTPFPWYARQLIRILRLKVHWTDDERASLEAVALTIFNRSGETVGIRSAYSYLIVFSEMMMLIAMTPLSYDSMELCTETLKRHLNTDRVNIISFALHSLMQIIQTTPSLTANVQSARVQLYKAMRNPDASVAKLAAAMLVRLGDETNCEEIVGEMMAQLPTAPIEVRKLLCHHIAELSKNYAGKHSQFLMQSMIQLLKTAGEFCPDKIWQMAVRVCAQQPELRQLAIDEALDYIRVTPDPPEPLMKLGIYIAGEYVDADPSYVLRLFTSRFGLVSPCVQAMIVTAIAKICTRCTDIHTHAVQFLAAQMSSGYPEVAQRAREYAMMLSSIPQSRNLLQSMPGDFGPEKVGEMIKKISSIANDDSGVSKFDVDNEGAEEDVPESNLLELFRVSDMGPIFINPVIHIDAQVKYQDKRAALKMIITNTGIIPITEIGVTLIPCAELKAEGVKASGKESMPGQSCVLIMAFTAIAPYENLPMLRFMYKVAGNQCADDFPIPIFPDRFRF